MTLLEKIIHKVEQQLEKKTHKINVRSSLPSPLPFITPQPLSTKIKLTKNRIIPHPTNNPNSAMAHRAAWSTKQVDSTVLQEDSVAVWDLNHIMADINHITHMDAITGDVEAGIRMSLEVHRED
jgi:hypothetical protein